MLRTRLNNRNGIYTVVYIEFYNILVYSTANYCNVYIFIIGLTIFLLFSELTKHTFFKNARIIDKKHYVQYSTVYGISASNIHSSSWHPTVFLVLSMWKSINFVCFFNWIIIPFQVKSLMKWNFYLQLGSLCSIFSLCWIQIDYADPKYCILLTS